MKDGKEKRMRANDGAVDSRGRYWVTTMNDPLVKDPTDEGIRFPSLHHRKKVDYSRRCVQT